MLWHIELKFCIWLCFTVLQIKFECFSICVNFCGSYAPFGTRILEIHVHSFPHFSLTPFYILSWKFAYYFFLYYRSSLSVVRVMPLCELRILEIHSFPHFSLTCFGILSWNFAYDFVLLYYRSSSSVFQFASIFVGVMPLLELRILEIHVQSFPHFSLTPFYILSWKFAYYFFLYYRSSLSVVKLRLFRSNASFRTLNTVNTVFCTFLLRALTYWAEILHKTLFYCTTGQHRSASMGINFWLEQCPFWDLEYWKYTVFRTFLLCSLTYWAEIFHITLFSVL